MLRLIARVLTDKFFSRPDPEYLDERLEKMLRHLRDTGRGEAADRFIKYEEEIPEVPQYVLRAGSFDGTSLHGVLFPPVNGKASHVFAVLVHGYRSSVEKDFALQFDFLRSLGFNILAVDQRAHGESGGEYVCLGAKEKYDLIAWLDLIKTHDPEAVFVLYGISMGSSTVLASLEIAAGGSQSVKTDDIKAVIADCGYVSPVRQLSFMARGRTKLPVKGILSAARKELLKKAGYDINDFDTAEILAKTSVPVLFVHGKKDGFVPVEFTYENYESCASAYKRLLEVPDASHAGSFIRAEKKYKEEILALLAEANLT